MEATVGEPAATTGVPNHQVAFVELLGPPPSTLKVVVSAGYRIATAPGSDAATLRALLPALEAPR